MRDMWLTGFDSPSMHTMYVDKPMRGANLMQAIARVNRTFKDKPAGLVVDYLGIAEDLKAALADYTVRDQESQELGQDLRAKAIPALISKHEVVCNVLHGFDWRTRLSAGGPKAFLNTLTMTVEYLISKHPGAGADTCTKDQPCLKCRFLAQTRDLVALYIMCVPSDEALAIRDDVAFFEAVRGQISKIEGSDREGVDPSVVLDTAIKQIVSEAMSGTGVIDIYAEAGLAKPDLSLIDDDFIEKFKKSKSPNLQIEMLKRILNDEIRRVGKRNIVTGRQFSEMLSQSILRYQNRTLDAAQVVAELVALAQTLKNEADRGTNLGLSDDELAFYDAIRTNDSAVLELGDETLKQIAHDLVEIVRRAAKTDWAVKEQVRAKLRATIKRLLLRYGYPPDMEEAATQLILSQAEVIAGETVA
ncbi:type I restriction enzyme endonuclease domain-containing protein [Gemmatimonas sp.]|uniref:type I restriction enzyme endonuclease domain-containing protein n=1 Tax=Gemmatimonas sp. TaxID=1962908 RepID=UPI0038B25CED